MVSSVKFLIRVVVVSLSLLAGVSVFHALHTHNTDAMENIYFKINLEFFLGILQ